MWRYREIANKLIQEIFNLGFEWDLTKKYIPSKCMRFVLLVITSKIVKIVKLASCISQWRNVSKNAMEIAKRRQSLQLYFQQSNFLISYSHHHHLIVAVTHRNRIWAALCPVLIAYSLNFLKVAPSTRWVFWAILCWVLSTHIKIKTKQKKIKIGVLEPTILYKLV